MGSAASFTGLLGSPPAVLSLLLKKQILEELSDERGMGGTFSFFLKLRSSAIVSILSSHLTGSLAAMGFHDGNNVHLEF